MRYQISKDHKDYKSYMELCSTLCGSVDRRGGFGRMDTCIPVAEPLPCSPETVTLLIGYTPLKDKKFLKKKDYEC